MAYCEPEPQVSYQLSKRHHHWSVALLQGSKLCQLQSRHLLHTRLVVPRADAAREKIGQVLLNGSMMALVICTRPLGLQDLELLQVRTPNDRRD